MSELSLHCKSDSAGRRFKLLQMYCQASAVTAVGVGLVVLYGWAFHIELFLSVFSGFVSMKANTALGLALSGMSLWLLLPSDATVGRRRLGRLLALFVVMLGACTLAEYVFGFDLAIDQLLFNEPVGAIATYAPGRMAPTSTTAFIAIGLSLLILDRKTRGGRAAQVLSLWAVLIAVLAIIGYMYHATALYRLLLSTQVAVHTAVTFFLLGTAIFFARPQQGIAGEITGNAAGSIMARRFLPAVVLIPISLGWMGLRGELAGLYRTEFGLALYASVSVLLFATLIWSNARKMNGECDQRSQAEVALRDLNADLEGRVADRTSALEQYAAVLAEQAALLDLAPDAIVVGDMQSRVLFWNRGAETIYGWSGREALGRHSTDLLKTEFFEPAEIVRAELLSDAHWEGDAVQYKRDGTRMIVASRSALQRDAEGTPIRILTINNDITHRRQAEARLAMLTDRLSLAAAVAKMGVWEWDLASNDVTWDNTMLEMYGFPRADSITYENWYATVWPEDRAQAEAALRKVVDEKGDGVMEFRILRQDGSLRNISGAFRAVFDDTSTAGRVIGVNVDITERKQAEEALEQSRQTQLRFKDEFLSHVSHEVRSPLFAIMQFTTIMLDGLAGEITEEQREYEQIVLQNARQMKSMIDDLLEVTRLESGKLSIELENLTVSDAVSDTLNTLHGNACEAGVSLSCQLPSGLPAAYADPTRLRQILIILIDNAIKFTPFGGSVRIQVRKWEEDGEFLCIEVSDTGCGIDPKHIDRVFERLYQTLDDCHTSTGLGLGLFICKQLVMLQGGRIWVESELQKGSTFSFTLPLFSLKKLLIPLLRNDNWPRDSAAIVVVGISLRDPWPNRDAQERWSREVRSLVRSCIMPNLDVLLPRMGRQNSGECFRVLAFADEQGASVLANRIRDQFERCPHLTQVCRDLTVTRSMLNSLEVKGELSADDLVNMLIENLEEGIRGHDVGVVHQM